MNTSAAIINELLELPEGDEKSREFYLTGILVGIKKPYADLQDEKKVVFAVPEAAVRELLRDFLSQNIKYQRLKELTNGE